MWFLNKLSISLTSKKFFLIFLTIPLLMLSGYFYNNKALSFRFVDEEDNFVIGKYLSQEEILYDDIITNHQPLTYIFGSIIHQYANPNSVYELLTRHRQFEIIWSIVWSIILVFYFGLGAFVAILIYEFTKIYLFGHLFLAESQIVYPLILIAGLVIFKKKGLKRWELILIGICLSISLFLLSSLWPALGFLLTILFYKQRHNFLSTLGFILIGFLLPLFLVFKFTSLKGYFYYVFYTNLFYTIPSYHSEAWVITVFKALFTPFQSLLTQENGPTAVIIKLISILLIINSIFLGFKKRFFEVIGIFIVLGLCNIRFITPGNQEYQGFHLLPWYATAIFITSILSIEVLTKSNIIFKILNILIIISIIGLSINFARLDLFQKRDKLNEYEINYSTAINRGDAVRVMKSVEDTLFVSPNAWIVYWQGDIDHLPKLYGYYTWMVGIPEVHASVLEAFTKNPPTYFYCENCKGLDLEKFLEKYTEIKNYGNRSFLYVHKSKIPYLTKDQLNQLKFYGFSFE